MRHTPNRSTAAEPAAASSRPVGHAPEKRGAIVMPAVKLLLALACLGLVACGERGCGAGGTAEGTSGNPGDPGNGEDGPPPTLTLAIITDLKGYLEPCGCTSRPLGGIDRLAAQIGATRDAGPTLTLVAGDIFFSGQAHGPEHGAGAHTVLDTPGATDASSAPQEEQEEQEDQEEQITQDSLNADTVADVLARFAVAAALPGPHDLAEGAALERLATRAALPLVGVQETSARLHEAGGRRVLIVGVGTEDPEQAASDVRTQLADPAHADRDLVVVLSRGGRRATRSIAQLEGVHVVVLGGADVDAPLPPATAGEAIVLHASRQGQGVTLAGVYLQPGQAPASGQAVVDISPWSVDVRAQTLRADIAEQEANIARWESEGTRADALNHQRARLEQMRSALAALAPPPPPEHGVAVAATFVELPPEAPQDPQVSAQMLELARRVNEHNRVALADWTPEPAAEGMPHYIGSEACASCHGDAVAWWRLHPHGRAYGTLQARDKEFNLSCVGCHVTGYLQPGGSTVTHNLDGALTNVGCENCHGPGSAHAASEGREAPARRDVPEQVCVTCHNSEHSDRFNYTAYRRTLVVPGHGLPLQGATSP